MKYLLVFGLVFLVAWRWRTTRESTMRKQAPRPRAVAPAEMVACHHCGVHLPAADAVAGRQHLYCCAAHRHAVEG